MIFYFDFLNIEINKKEQKCEIYRACTRGIATHVYGRERLRGAEVMHVADVTWTAYFIFLIYIIYITHKSSDYRKTRLLNPIFSRTLYTDESPQFIPCGTKIFPFSLFQGDVVSFRASDSIVINAMTSMRWTRDPSDQTINTCFNSVISERIITVDQDYYNGPDLFDTMDLQPINATRSRSDSHHEETSIRSTNAQSRPLIAMKLHPTANI